VLKRGPAHLTRAPSEYLKSVWLDVVSPLPLAIKFGHDFMGPDRLLFSSDHPWVEPGVIIDCVAAAGLSDGAQEKIFSGNARDLFRL
jgi:predicted TIM-barrel fold metal-dependent hydrolase